MSKEVCLGVNSQADGSCTLHIGESLVNSSVTWARRGTRDDAQNRASLNVNFRFPSGLVDNNSRAVSQMLIHVFSNALDFSRIPFCEIEVTVVVLSLGRTDVWALGVYGVLFACLDGGLPMLTPVVPQTVVLSEEGALTPNPTPDAEAKARAVGRFAFDKAGRVVFEDIRGVLPVSMVKTARLAARSQADNGMAWVRKSMGQ